MNEPTPCPDVHALRTFVEGGAGACADRDAAARLEAHLASCAYCRGRAEGLGATRRIAQPGDSGWAPPEGTITVPEAPAEGGADADRSATVLLVPVGGEDGEGQVDLGFLLPPARADTLGRLGDYDVLGVLGRGGMGVVLKAYDATLNRAVAIKVLAPALAGRPDARQRFLAEARAAAAINHPNVVTIHDVKVQRGMPYLVMEYLGGPTLRQRIRQGPPLRPLELVRIALQVAQGLAAAHEQGVIHRDIKPGNVMFGGELDRIKITDFGLARAVLDLDDPPEPDRVVGTPAYIPPETVLARPVDERSDLFSLGCVIHAMVTGHSPFHGTRPADVLRKIIAADATPLHVLDPAVPRPLSLLVSQLLQKDPASRPTSAGAVAAVLGDLLASLQLRGDRSSWSAEGLRALSPAPPEPPARTLRTVAANSAAVLGLALLLALGLHRLDRPPAGEGEPARPDAAAAPAAPVLTVGPSAGADHRTLGAAIAAVERPGTTIRLEPGPHVGLAQIAQRPELEGLTIEPAGPHPRDAVVLRGPGAHNAVVTVDGVAGVTLRRLTLEAAPDQYALQVRQAAPGLTVEEVAFRKRPVAGPKDVWSHAWLAHGAHGEPDAPITFRRCAFAPWRAGLVLQGDRGPIAFVDVDSCRFDGGTRPVELLVVTSDVRVHGCLFLGGEDGVCFNLLAAPSGRISIDHNTFFRTRRWIDPKDLDGDVRGVAITANALLEVPAFDVPDGELAACRDGGWTIAGNRAEGPADAVGHGLVTLVPRLAVRSRDPADPMFLRPAPGSALLDPASGPPGHVGALAPARNVVAAAP
jgi:hypothetical protein